MSITVVIADDHAAIRSGLALLLGQVEGIEIVGQARDGDEAITMVARLRPDVVLMDVRMPGTDGIAATTAIVGAGHAAVLVLTSFDLDDTVYDALRAGASGFLLKTAETDTIIAAIESVARGDAVLAPEVTRRVIERITEPRAPAGQARSVTPTTDLDILTERERGVLECIGGGLSNAEIARTLFIGETTVKTHVSHILTKLGVASRVQAAIVARESR